MYALHVHCTFITRDERFRPALQGGRNDGAVSMWKDVLWVVEDVFPAVGTSLQERSSNGKQVQTHAHPVNTNTSDSRQAVLDHADSLIPFLAGLESVGLCGCQMIVNERGKRILNPDHNSHGLWCVSPLQRENRFLSIGLCAARSFSQQHLCF